MEKLKNNILKDKNGFLIACCSCLVLLLALCYLGFNNGSSLKGTYSATGCTYSCSIGIPVSQTANSQCYVTKSTTALTCDQALSAVCPSGWSCSDSPKTSTETNSTTGMEVCRVTCKCVGGIVTETCPSSTSTYNGTSGASCPAGYYSSLSACESGGYTCTQTSASCWVRGAKKSSSTCNGTMTEDGCVPNTSSSSKKSSSSSKKSSSSQYNGTSGASCPAGYYSSLSACESGGWNCVQTGASCWARSSKKSSSSTYNGTSGASCPAGYYSTLSACESGGWTCIQTSASCWARSSKKSTSGTSSSKSSSSYRPASSANTTYCWNCDGSYVYGKNTLYSGECTKVDNSLCDNSGMGHTCGNTDYSTWDRDNCELAGWTWDATNKCCNTKSGSNSSPSSKSSSPGGTGGGGTGGGGTSTPKQSSTNKTSSANKSSSVVAEKSSSSVNQGGNPTSYAPAPSSNVTQNPQTGQIAIFLVWMVTLGAITYSVWYFKKIKES